MVDLPQKKVGIVACSGEELAEGTVTRLAALKVLEELRPGDTVTICLPLFLAGGEGDRAFAKFYPTIAVDGCDKRCAAKGTEMYSGKPAVSLVVSDLVQAAGLEKPQGCWQLSEAGKKAVALTSEKIAENVDGLLGKRWNRRKGEFELPIVQDTQIEEPVVATCSCGSGIPIQSVTVAGKSVQILALPLIFQQALEAGKSPDASTINELLETIKIYNPVPSDEEAAYLEMVSREYAIYLERQAKQ